MRKLKCTNCGGALTINTTPDGHVVGQCGHCGAEYVIDAKGRQHIVVEHRFPDGVPQAKQAQTSPVDATRRKLAFGAIGIAAAVLLGGPLVRLFTRSTSAAPSAPLRAIFNVGGEGSAPGQFRNSVFDVAVDSLGRALVRDNDDRYYVFGPDGAFLAHYPRPFDGRGSYIGLLPTGDLIVAANRQLARIDLLTGETKDTMPAPDYIDDWTLGAGECVTPDGGLAFYRVPNDLNPDRSSLGHGASVPGNDVLILFNRNLKETRRLTGLLSQAIAPDPMVSKAPEPVSIAIDGSGSIYIYVIPREDHDTRGGIFEFNADGRFQRRIAVEQKYFGMIAAAPDGTLWASDVWMQTIQHITPTGVHSYPTTGLGQGPGTQTGNVTAIATYPDGTLALLSNDRLVRAELVAD